MCAYYTVQTEEAWLALLFSSLSFVMVSNKDPRQSVLQLKLCLGLMFYVGNLRASERLDVTLCLSRMIQLSLS